MLMDWKSQCCQDVNSPQVVQIQYKPNHNLSKFFFLFLEIDSCSKIHMEVQIT